MSRIAARFAQLKQRGRKGLIPFIVAGDPVPSLTVPLMHALVEAGADLIELGAPFSDPMADGPVIQGAYERALRQDVGLTQALEIVAQFRVQDARTPVVLMGYLNPIEVMGYDRFAEAAAKAGIDGVIVVDMPPEEAGEFASPLRRRGLDQIFLLAPTSDLARIELVVRRTSGFVYYVSLKGVTGAANIDFADIRRRLATIRARTDLPIGIGFGIGTPEAAAQASVLADAVVVGTALVRHGAELASQPAKMVSGTGAFLANLRRAIDEKPLAAKAKI